MSREIGSISEFKCPLCRKPLASEEYKSALEELKKKESVSYEGKVKEIQSQFDVKIKKVGIDHAEEIEKVKQIDAAKMQSLEASLKASYQEQLDILKKSYEQLNEGNRQHFELMSKQVQEANTKVLEEKDKQLKDLVDGQARFKDVAKAEAAVGAKAELDRLQLEVIERDVQLRRFQDEVDGLKKQIQQSQSELKGEAGELDLYESLITAFANDHITRQKRGTSSGDLIQKIRTVGGELDAPIVYDNKESMAVTKQDIEKAKGYKKTHHTNYVIIVSRNLPKKEVPNGMLGQKDGILLAHPSIVVELAEQIRTAMIEIERHADIREHRQSKETRLFEYIISPEFHRSMIELSQVHSQLSALQVKEEKQHQTLWKERKAMVERLVGNTTDLESEIESILGNNKENSKKLGSREELLS